MLISQLIHLFEQFHRNFTTGLLNGIIFVLPLFEDEHFLSALLNFAASYKITVFPAALELICLELQALDLAIMPLFLILKLFILSLDLLIHLFFSGDHILKLGQFLDAEVFSSVLVHFEDLDRAIGSSLHEAIHVWIDLCL